MHDAFVSYSSHDKSAADAVCHALEADGIRCWIAPRDILPGKDWSESILDGIANARVLVLVLSQYSSTSKQVQSEVLTAVQEDRIVVPFRIENINPRGALKLQLTGTHWLDAFPPPLDPHLKKLCKTLRMLLAEGSASAHEQEPASGDATAPQPRVEEPEQANLSPDEGLGRRVPLVSRTPIESESVRERPGAMGSKSLLYAGGAVGTLALIVIVVLFFGPGAAPKAVVQNAPAAASASASASAGDSYSTANQPLFSDSLQGTLVNWTEQAGQNLAVIAPAIDGSGKALTFVDTAENGDLATKTSFVSASGLYTVSFDFLGNCGSTNECGAFLMATNASSNHLGWILSDTPFYGIAQFSELMAGHIWERVSYTFAASPNVTLNLENWKWAKHSGPKSFYIRNLMLTDDPDHVREGTVTVTPLRDPN
jgi:TIR domain